MIDRLDPAIFAIGSQTTTNDRISFLRLQRLLRGRDGAYCYLEIGSHLGGSLVPHLADPRCAWVVSIDPRPLTQPDERGALFAYEENSTARMIAGLRRHLPEASLRRLQTFDLDAAAVPHAELRRPVQLALIDGEHTNTAAFSDFLSVLPLLADDAVVAWHDSNLITDAIQNVERFLDHGQIPYYSVFLPDNVAAIGLRGLAGPLRAGMREVALERDPFVAEARRKRQMAVALEVLTRNDLGLLYPLKRMLRAAVTKRSGRRAGATA